MIMVISPKINLKVEEKKSATIRIEKIRCHSKGFFATDIRDRPVTAEERAEISSRLDSLERDINRIW
jgi:hypothetical protein